MLLITQAASSSKGTALQLWLRQKYCKVICPISYNATTKNLELQSLLQKTSFQKPLKKLLHVTKANRDLEGGLRALGSGIAATGVIGSGIGLGLIFGSVVNAVARNPSVAGKAFNSAILGAAFCESVGLFALVISFINLP